MPSKVTSIVLGGAAFGIFATVMSVIAASGDPSGPLGMIAGCVSCLGYAGAGLLAVWHYTSTHQLTLPVGQGVGMGAATGALAAVVALLLTIVLRAVGVLPTVEDIIMQMEASGAFDQMGQAQLEQTQQFMEMSNGPIGWAIGLVLGAVLGLVGGAIGAAVFKKGDGTSPSEPDLQI